mmetsp:Transcript_114/g.328  ORF Transcript_114/g.328 Transcript_114/m.328 type:complete len:327 (+) Transcript_114:114-1094(+)
MGICLSAALADTKSQTSNEMDGSKMGNSAMNSTTKGHSAGVLVERMGLEAAVQHMNGLDLGKRLRLDVDFSLNKQGHSRRDDSDPCPHPLFATVDHGSEFWASDTVTTFVALLDNYVRETGRSEHVTTAERREVDAFLAACAATPHFELLLAFVKYHGRDPRCRDVDTMDDLKALLKELWFTPYRRWRPDDSSGFEHVFVGEESRGKIIGLHNWVQYYLEEKKGNIDYLGWTGRQDTCVDDTTFASIKFAWADDDANREIKPISTILCGSTPEFELAALSLVFLCGTQEGDNLMRLGEEKIKIVCYPKTAKGGKVCVGSAFIEIAK